MTRLSSEKRLVKRPFAWLDFFTSSNSVVLLLVSFARSDVFCLPLKTPSLGEVNLLQTYSPCYPKC